MKRSEKIDLSGLRSEIEKTRLEMVRATAECKNSVDLLAVRFTTVEAKTTEIYDLIQGGVATPGLREKIALVQMHVKHIWWLWSVVGAIVLALLSEILGWFRPG